MASVDSAKKAKEEAKDDKTTGKFTIKRLFLVVVPIILIGLIIFMVVDTTETVISGMQLL